MPWPEWDRRSVDAVASLLAQSVPGLPNLITLLARDGTPMYGMHLGTGDHNAVWQLVRSACVDSGLWPVLTQLDPSDVGTPPLLTLSPEQTLAKAATCDAEDLLAEMIDDQAWAFGFGDWWTEADDQIPPPETLAEHLGGPLPVRPGRSRFNTDMAVPATWLYLVPAASYEVPAVWGLPSTPNWTWRNHRERQFSIVDHVAVLRSWHERYDAELIYLSSCSLELVVRRPPTERIDIARVSLEQYAYCYDLDQYIGNVEDVARAQVATDRWYFWWD